MGKVEEESNDPQHRASLPVRMKFAQLSGRSEFLAKHAFLACRWPAARFSFSSLMGKKTIYHGFSDKVVIFTNYDFYNN